MCLERFNVEKFNVSIHKIIQGTVKKILCIKFYFVSGINLIGLKYILLFQIYCDPAVTVDFSEEFNLDYVQSRAVIINVSHCAKK